MADEDNEKIPEEVWALEMAEENYIAEEEENYGEDSPKPKAKSQKKQILRTTEDEEKDIPKKEENGPQEEDTEDEDQTVENAEMVLNEVLKDYIDFRQFLDHHIKGVDKDDEEDDDIPMEDLEYILAQPKQDQDEDPELADEVLALEAVQLEDNSEEKRNIEKKIAEEVRTNLTQNRRTELKPKEKTVANMLSEILETSLERHNEEKGIKTLKKLKEGKPIETESKPKTYYGRANLQDLNEDELNLLFKTFTFQGQIVFLKVNDKWEPIIRSLLRRQKYLWFSNEEINTKRFYPIDDCCETCSELLDSEPVSRVQHYLYDIITEVLFFTPELTCLRLFRFEFNQISMVRALHKNCPKLTHLDLTECHGLQQLVIRELVACFPLIKHLILKATNLDEYMLSLILKGMKNLESLDVGATLITGQAFSRVMSKKLKRLDIRCCPDLDIESLIKTFRTTVTIESSKLRGLEHLKVDAYQSGEFYQRLGHRCGETLILLEVMDFDDIVINGDLYFNGFNQLRHLQSLKIGKNIAIGRILNTILLTTSQQLKSFSFESNELGDSILRTEDLLAFADRWAGLQRLEVMNCRLVDEIFIDMLCKLQDLKYLNLSKCSKLKDWQFGQQVVKFKAVDTLILDQCHNLGKTTLDNIILRAHRMTNQVLRSSMLKCNLRNLPYLKGKLLPTNLRITYSTISSKKYTTFDGQRTKSGRMEDIIEILREK